MIDRGSPQRWDWEQEDDYHRYLKELERERWASDSFARMRDSAFAIASELRSFLEFTALIARGQLVGDLPNDVWSMWDNLGNAPPRHRRLDEARLATWLRRTNNFEVFVRRTRSLSSTDTSLERKTFATQALLRSWVDELSMFALEENSTWQSVVFFYSVESALAALVCLISDTRISTHARVLNELRSRILCPLSDELFPPIEFTYRKIGGEWICDFGLPTNSVVEMCPSLTAAAVSGRHGDWITFFHLLHTVSVIYRYKSALPFLMTGSPRLRNCEAFIWDLNLVLKLWLEVLICAAMGAESLADFVRIARHQFLQYHQRDIASLAIRWRIMEEAGLLDLSRPNQSSTSHRILRAMHQDPLGLMEGQ